MNADERSELREAVREAILDQAEKGNGYITTRRIRGIIEEDYSPQAIGSVVSEFVERGDLEVWREKKGGTSVTYRITLESEEVVR